MTTTGAEPLTCTRHGTPTRLRCAECETPICPECLVKTPVGLKCPEHAEAVPAVVPRPKRPMKQVLLVAIGVVAVAGGVLALVLAVGGGESGDTAGEGGPALAPEQRIQTPQVAVMAADGTGKRVVTNRPLAFDSSPAWAPDGSRIAFESLVDGRRSIWVMQADGEGIRRLTDGTGVDSSPAWSPDSSRIAFMSDRDGNSEVYVMNADGTGVRRLTDLPGQDGYPAWSPDGARLAFVSDRDGAFRLWTMGADGSNPIRLLDQPAVAMRPSYFRDGRRLAFTSDADGDPEIYLVSVDGTGLIQLTDNSAADGEPDVSPDGSRIVFASDRDGTPSVYVMAADGTDVQKLTTGPRGFTPAWSPDGRTVVYITEPG